MNNFTKTETVLFDLIKKELFGIPFIQPDNVDWDAVFLEAQRQTISGLIAKHVPERAGSQWQKVYSINIGNSIRNLHAQSELIELFKDYRIPLAILKGTAAAVYYPAPANRMMGDIDFIVPQDCFERACNLMIEHGYALHKPNPAYTRHKGFIKDSISYELHHHFSYEDLDIEQYIIEGFGKTEQGVIDGIAFPMLPKCANGLVLLAHMRNHLKSGLGLRQVIDWMMYVDRELDDGFWESEFREAAAGAGMEKLAITAARMCQIYLGLRSDICWCKEADKELCTRLMKNLMSYGNFGRKHGTGNKIETVATRIKKDGIFRYLQKSGETTWMFYRRHRWLKPFCWLYQAGRIVVKGLQSGRGKKALQDINRSNERYGLLRELDIVR